MNRYPVWLDCDAGVDDAIALIALHTLEELELQGISAVCGNAALSDTYRNVHRINGLLGAHYPVYRGADRPLFRELHVSEAFHGRDGLGDVDLPVPPHEDSETAAWDALYACAKAHPGELQLVATGPLTNLAIAFAKYRELPGLLGRILLMGGSASAGNITPAAEFNIYDDPEAASVVFQAGVPLVMCGLDVTLKALLRPADWDEGGFVFPCRGGEPPGVARAGFGGLSIPPGADSFRSCGKNRKKGTPKGRAFYKAALPFGIPSSEIGRPRAPYDYRARSRPPAVPRNRTGSGMSVCVFDGAPVGNGLDRSP
jgi:hypothetical protein